MFPQPDRGLSELGVAAVRAMVRERVLIDVAHMSARALDETLDAARRARPRAQVPVVATHAGYRFGRQEYMLDGAAVERIAARDGVVGLIFAEHQILDGLRRRRHGERSTSRSRSSAATSTALREITGSHRHTAIGSDLDGFIKPTLAGLQTMADMAPLERALVERYGAADGGADRLRQRATAAADRLGGARVSADDIRLWVEGM